MVAPGAPAELEPVFFDTDSKTFSAAQREVLDRDAALLAAQPQVHVVIEGHTDASGPAEANYNLGILRARSVALYLIDKGIDGSRIEIVSYGETRPLEPSTRRAARLRNRRVQFLTYLPGDEPGPPAAPPASPR